MQPSSYLYLEFFYNIGSILDMLIAGSPKISNFGDT